ncbi:hypothetical protein EV183_002903 [Coemansia sp. RSA 2336]|nr:hypothetical protein EV183_002903 [Coemansia sp. RSA 2336]
MEEWIKRQEELKAQLITHDDASFTYNPSTGTFSNLHRVAGVDISYMQSDASQAIVSLCIFSFPTLSCIHEETCAVPVTEPYQAGFLAFREIHAYQHVFAKLPAHMHPQVVLVDGNGVLHPRRFGSACHLGVQLNVPTVGVAKNLLHLDDVQVDARELKERFRKGERQVVLEGTGGVYGMAVAPGGSSASNPVFVSVGHKVGLDTAVALARACSMFRVPEPIRMADQRSREMARIIDQQNAKVAQA